MTGLRAWLRERVKSYFSYYKVGGFVIIFIGIGLYLVFQVYNLAAFPVRFFTDSRIVIAAVLLIIPPFFGFLLTRNSFLFQGYYIGRLSQKYPRITKLLEIFSVRNIKENKFPEVKIEAVIGDKRMRLLGFVVKEFWQEEELWCRVAIPTYPLPITGNLVEIRKTDLFYTGRNFEDVTYTFLSFGTK